MALDPSTLLIAYRRGQLDMLTRVHFGRDGLLGPELRHSLALRVLTRAWAQYREDRGIQLGERLVGGECAAERNAFLTLIANALPDRESPLFQAVRTVRKAAAAPLAAEVKETARIVTRSTPQIEAVLETLNREKLPGDPLERLLFAISPHLYSTCGDSDALRATVTTPCWAFNLSAVVRPDAFKLSSTALAFPGIVRRRIFRADVSQSAKRNLARETMLTAMHESAYDVDRAWKADRRFAQVFPNLRSSSRLRNVWLLVAGLEELTAAQLARALPATRAGAGKLLRKLADARLVRGNGPFTPYVCNPIPAESFAAFDMDMATAR